MAKKIFKILAALAAMVVVLAVPAQAGCKQGYTCKKIKIKVATGYKYKYVTRCYKKKKARHKPSKKIVVKKIYVQAAMPANPFRGATNARMERIVDPGSERMAKVAVAGVKALGYVAGQAVRRPNITKISNGNRVNVNATASAAAQAAASSSTNHSGGCQNGGCVKQPDVPSNYGNIAKKPGSNYGGVDTLPVVNPGPDL